MIHPNVFLWRIQKRRAMNVVTEIQRAGAVAKVVEHTKTVETNFLERCWVDRKVDRRW